MNMNKIHLDFIWSSQKEYFSLKPLYEESKNFSLETRFLKIHRNKIRNLFSNPKLADNIVISHNEPLNRIKKMGWNGRYIYVEHGLDPAHFCEKSNNSAWKLIRKSPGIFYSNFETI